MRTSDIRELTDQELDRELANSHKELMNLRFRLATKQLTNTAEPRVIKRNISKIKTIIHERELQRDGR